MAVKARFSWIFLPGLLLVLFVINITMGSVDIPLNELIPILLTKKASSPIWVDIIWDFRITKAFTCILAGSALAVSGLQMQTLFRNPLAGPDVLGLSSGASLAVSLIFMSNAAGFVLYTLETPWAIAVASSLGCAAVFIIMIAVARRIQDNVSLLIVGLMVGAATSSVVSVLQYLSRAEEMQVYLFWTFGSLTSLSWYEIAVLSVLFFSGFLISALSVKPLNAWLLGDLYAQSLGVNIKSSRLWIIFSTSILTGGVTAFCGPIAFVGLAVPHLVKILIRTSDHKVLLPAVAIGGASLLLFCDIISQLPENFILPINAITAIIGAPVVIWVILKNKIVNS
jgi:iron complex transport system permease protein